MKKARSNVVGAKSPEKSSASIALRRSAIPEKRSAGSRPRARRSSSASGFGRGPCSPVVAVTRAARRAVERVFPLGGLPGERLEQDQAERVHVGARLPRPPGGLLGRQVAPLLDREEVRAAQGRPQAEALQLHLPVERHHEPRRCDEAVREGGARVVLLAVQELERDRRPARDHERVVGREGEGFASAAIEDGRDRAALHQLGGHVHGVLHPADAEHAHEARVLKPRREARLVHQALRGLGVRGDLGPEPQDGDEAVETVGAEPRGTVLEPEGARARFFEEDELAELLPESHVRARRGSARCRPRTGRGRLPRSPTGP